MHEGALEGVAASEMQDAMMSMSGIHTLMQDIQQRGTLSDAQLETIVYANMRFQNTIEGGKTHLKQMQMDSYAALQDPTLTFLSCVLQVHQEDFSLGMAQANKTSHSCM